MAKSPKGQGSIVLIGTGGRDKLEGGSGDDVLEGHGGDDRLDGSTGDDTLDGGAGDDNVRGGDGDDRLTYVAAENRDSDDDYDGGRGDDTLVLQLTRADWMNPWFQYDLARFDGEHTFRAFNLAASNFETLEVVVDGVVLSAADDPVVLAADALGATEEAAGAAVNVLANDQVADLVRTVSHGQAGHGQVQMVLALNDPAGQARADFTYTPDAAYWQRLGAGQTGTDSFTYTVVDADGDYSTATVLVTVHGVNDAPVLLGGQGGALAGSIGFRDVDLTDVHQVTVEPGGSLGALTATVVENPFDTNNTGRIDWSFAVDAAAYKALAAGQTASQTQAVTLTDGAGGSVSTQVTVTLTGVNDAPVATGETAATTAQDAPVTIATAALLANDSDPDGDSLTVLSVGAARNGSVLMTAQGVVFTPASGFTGEAAFDYQVSDGKGGLATATALVVVQATSGPVVYLDGDDMGNEIRGGPGREWINGRGGADTIFGGGAADTILGGAGSDYIEGGDGDDVIGGVGEDFGYDTIRGGRGDDRILEGADSDLYLYALGDGNDVISDHASADGFTDVLWLTDLNPSDVILRQAGTSLLVLIKANGHTIELTDQINGAPANFGVEKIRFADNTEWTRAEFETLSAPPAPADDFLFG